MKVSNNINVTHIDQDKLKKAQNKTTGDTFSKLLDSTTNNQSVNVSDASALKHAANANLNFPINNVRANSVSDSSNVDPAERLDYARRVAANTPEIREEKVAHIKALYDAGQYDVSPMAVAEKLWATGVLTASWQ